MGVRRPDIALAMILSGLATAIILLLAVAIFSRPGERAHDFVLEDALRFAAQMIGVGLSYAFVWIFVQRRKPRGLLAFTTSCAIWTLVVGCAIGIAGFLIDKTNAPPGGLAGAPIMMFLANAWLSFLTLGALLGVFGWLFRRPDLDTASGLAAEFE